MPSLRVMRSLSVLVLVLTVLSGCSLAQKNSSSVRIAAVMSLSIPLTPGTFNQIYQPLLEVMPEMINVINNDTSLLQNTTLNLSITDTQLLQPLMLAGMLRESRTGAAAAIGGIFDLEAIALATSSTVLKFPVVIQYSGLPSLSNRELYPFTCRMTSSNINQVTVIFDLFDHFYGITKQIQWKQPAVVSGANPYGISLGEEFIKKAEVRGFYVPTYQQFLGTTNTISAEVADITPQIISLKESKARVFVALLLAIDMQTFVRAAKDYGLFNPNNVWLCSDGCAQNFIQYNTTAYPNQTLIVPDHINTIQGMMGVTVPIDVESEKYQFLIQAYLRNFNLTKPMGSNTGTLYDGFYTLGYALDHLIKQNLPQNVTNIVAAIRNVSFAGSTGWVDFDSNCERKPVYDIVNVWRGLECPECLGLHPTDIFVPVGRWNHSSGLNMYRPVHFFDGTTEIPDLNLHRSFDYFDCKDGRKKTDETGKTIDLEKPKWGAGNIDADYYCDEYLDCDDMSDEPYDCVPSFKILFIIYGIITGLLILFTILVFVPFTILFGFIIPRRRVRASSPLFLLIIIVSGVFGYGSTYAWYGKPQSVACGFQPWLLGLAIVSMNSALIAKTFRIWRVFRSPFQVKVISNVELIVLWIILVAPVLLILFLWTLVSTPTAKLEEHDGLEHLVCGPGGFTDSIVAGYVWFFLLVGYQGLVMLVGIFLTFAIRNVPSKFNEGKLIAISIYNITLLGVIVIPVFLVLRYTIPFVAWIIRTTVIIYVFTATLWLQFLPKIGGVFISDKLKEPAMQDTTNSPNNSTRYDTNAI